MTIKYLKEQLEKLGVRETVRRINIQIDGLKKAVRIIHNSIFCCQVTNE